jgi:hypothetical protein
VSYADDIFKNPPGKVSFAGNMSRGKMISKQDLIKLLKKEFSTTLKVMRAYPSEKSEFKPHERSSTAIGLTSTFVFELYLINRCVFGDAVDRSVFQTYKPGSVQAVADDFEKECARILNRLEELPEAELNKTVEFAGVSFIADEFIMMMLHDQIHHRGQLSVYVRMAGGKVPSIYGPSADDKAPNF